MSNSLNQAEWRNSTVVGIADLTRLKSEGDLHISGSGSLVRSLLEYRLLDEMTIMMCPMALGRGQRLLESVAATALDLVNVTPFPRGVLCLTWRAA